MKNFPLSFSLLFSLLFSISINSQSIATYNIEFESIWESVADNPTDGQSTIALPGNAHWSGLVITTHKTAGEFLKLGEAASPGIESVAETGATSTFETEVNNNADANQYINAGGLNSAKGTISRNGIQVSEEFPLVTLASMIAPSPDWFIALDGENLRSGNNSINNGWKDTFTVDVYPLDAGTEDGDGYSGNTYPDTNPIGVITSRSNSTPFNANKIGTITFTYVNSTLSNDESESLRNFSIYPNPTKGKITLSNIKHTKLISVKIYNVLGRLVKDIPVETAASKLEIDLSHLSKGVYLLNLKSDTKSSTKKLVIN